MVRGIEMQNVFDTIPVSSGNVFDSIPTEPSPPQADLSGLGKDPYDAFKLEESKSLNREDYPLTVPPSLNPNNDFIRSTHGQTILAPPLALAAKLLGSENPEEAPFQPLVKFPTVSDEDLKNLPGWANKVGRVANEVTGTLTGLSSPISLAQLPVNEGMAIPFGSQLAADVPGDVKDVIDSKDSNERTTALARLGTKLAMGAMLANGRLKETPEPSVQGPPAIGSMLKMPEGAEVPLNVESFEPLSPESGSPLSPQELIAHQIRNPYGVKELPISGEADAEKLTNKARETLAKPTSSIPITALRYTIRPNGKYDINASTNFENAFAAGGGTLAVENNLTYDQLVAKVGPHVAEAIKNHQGTNKHEDNGWKTGEFDLSQIETPSAQGNEPVPLAGDARGEPNEETPQVADPVKKFVGDVTSGSKLTTEDAQQAGLNTRSIADLDELAKADADLKSKQEDLKQKIQSERDPEKRNQLFNQAMSLGGQIPREAIESATNTGGHVEGEGLVPTKLGDRPLDWRNNPEVAKWLLNNAGKIGIPLPEELESRRQEFVGMGGAVPSEFNPGGNQGREVYGISQEAREARERAGQVGPVEPGVGISAADSVDHGRQLLKSGADPEKSLSNFEATGKWSSDDIAVTRAHGEQLAQEARAAERKFGTDSPEHKAAFDKLTDWDARTKKLNTEWHKAGQAQQGATDIDTGSFTGLAREFKSQTGKEFTPKQAKEAKDLSGEVSNAADSTEAANNKLLTEIDKTSGDPKTLTDAERRALDAANKVVRESAVRLAAAETKARVAKSAAEKKAAEAERAKEQKILDLAHKQAREQAIKLADAENKQRVSDAKRTEYETQKKATQRALDAANKTVREAAAARAKAESDARVAKSAQENKIAQDEVRRTQKALDAANRVVRNAAAQAAKNARADSVLKADTFAYAWKKARGYIDSGVTNFDDIRNKLAVDLGMPVEKVTTALAKTKRAKLLTDDLWRKQQNYRRLDQQAKRWLAEQQTPGLNKVIQSLPNLAFAAKVFGHGTVALGTHAPMVAFQPRYWKAYANDFVKMYRMVGSTPFYENQIQDLIRRPNYTTARRAGLVNDPYQYEDYNSPEVTKWMGPVANMGNRGYSVLKILRQDMFDQQWKNLPKTQQIPEVAESIADGINHATGVVRSKAPKGSNIALFAPRLAASRAAWLVADPLRAVKAFSNWKNASEGEKSFAINQVKEKAWVMGTMLSLLAINEGILEASGSNQRVNMTDPMKKDWMKFKVGGMNVGYGNAMLSMARLPARLYKIRSSDGGKLKNLVYPDEDTYSVLGEYGRSQLSPFAGLALNLWLKSDWQNRPLPNSDRPVPKRLKAQGVQPYTWPEFWAEQALPIPAEEAAREVWKNGLGMSGDQIKQASKALATLSVMAATGARVEDDTDKVGP